MPAGLLLLTALASVRGDCPHVGISALFSDPTTWPHPLDWTREVVLDFPLLLDTATPRLPGMRIIPGGRLVFSPLAASANLTSDYVRIEIGGSLEIGSEDCPFSGRAEVLLTGKRGAYSSEDGEKYIAVHRGGCLEVHGRLKRPWTRLRATVEKGARQREILLQDNVSSWGPADKLVIASSNTNFNEAEEVEVVQCDQKSCTVSGRLRFDHFGEEDGGVAMQAEVGLLSRNIVIRGEMEAACYEPNPCDEFDFDTFGGHIMAREGFAGFHVEHAELTQMGQLGILGRYPLHWHMAGQLTEGDSYVRSNSIHHTAQRCVTCHTTFGCRIEDNVAHDHLGHCFFLEDGVEKDTVLQGNLGLGTRRTSSSGIPSDRDPATFWVTHPRALVRGNTAAGSEGKGFWFLQASLPTGGAGRRQEAGTHFYFTQGELFRTPLKGISGNTAHSSRFGLFFDQVLQPDQGAEGPGKFDPREDPIDPRSPRLTSQVEDLTCYMAMATCLWFRFKNGNFSNLRVADSREGMFSHDINLITESTFIGESANFGVRASRQAKNMERFGFRNYLNPSLLSGVTFRNFPGPNLAGSGSLHALGVKRIGANSLYTGSSGSIFVATPDSGRISEHKTTGRQFLYRDWTGEVSGSSPGSYIVSQLPHLVSSRCTTRLRNSPGKLSVCPHSFYTLKAPGGTVELTRLDIPDYTYTSMENENFLALSSKHTHLLSFPGDTGIFGRRLPVNSQSKPRVTFKLIGADFGTVLQLAICVPLNSAVSLTRGTRAARSMDDFRSDSEGSAYYHDQDLGLLWLRVVGNYSRLVGDFQPCGVGGQGCFTETMKFDNLGIERATDCRARTRLLDQIATGVGAVQP